MKEPLSAHSKSSGSDDVKPLSSRKTKGPKHNSSNNEKINENASEKVSIKSEDICGEVDGAEGKCDLTKVKIEQQELVKTVAENGSGSVPNILEEAVKIIFDESTGAESTDITCNTDVVHPGMFAGMNSQPMVSLHSGECKDVSYEAVAQTMAGPIENNPTNMEEHDVDITVKGKLVVLRTKILCFCLLDNTRWTEDVCKEVNKYKSVKSFCLHLLAMNFRLLGKHLPDCFDSYVSEVS